MGTLRPDSEGISGSGRNGRGAENERPVEMGRSDEQLQRISEGDSNQGTDRNWDREHLIAEAEVQNTSAFSYDEANELVARGVLMEARSVEDNGDGIEFNVFCYNVEPDVEIDYATGESWAAEKATEAPTAPPTQAPTQAPVVQQEVVVPQQQNNSRSYILNTNTKNFHYGSCSSIKQMSDKNKQEYTGSRDDLIAQGYSPCGRCCP